MQDRDFTYWLCVKHGFVLQSMCSTRDKATFFVFTLCDTSNWRQIDNWFLSLLFVFFFTPMTLISGRRPTERKNFVLRSCVRMEAAVLGSQSLTVLLASVDVKRHWTCNGTELRSCVRVVEAVLGSQFLIVLMVSVDVKQHWRKERTNARERERERERAVSYTHLRAHET